MQRRLLYVASNNRHKLEELQALFPAGWEVRPAQELCPGLTWDETGTTFLENAKIKANVVKALTPHCVLADDSGLAVDALGGAPGVHSSRYAGREGDDASNNAKLLTALENVPDDERTARFLCTIVFIDERGALTAFEGYCEGSILRAKRGTHGFGYDPLFLVQGTGLAMAELPAESKNKISHRAVAMQKLKRFLHPS